MCRVRCWRWQRGIADKLSPGLRLRSAFSDLAAGRKFLRERPRRLRREVQRWRQPRVGLTVLQFDNPYPQSSQITGYGHPCVESPWVGHRRIVREMPPCRLLRAVWRLQHEHQAGGLVARVAPAVRQIRFEQQEIAGFQHVNRPINFLLYAA
jgi:hypothetical protein